MASKTVAEKPENVLLSVRDVVRYAVTCFHEAGISYGHGTGDALEESIFIVFETLRLPFDDTERWWEARLTLSERRKIIGLIGKRIKTRKPAAYLLNRAYIQGVPFYVDERVIVPRSYIGELLFSGEFQAGGPLIGDPDAVEAVLDLCTGSGCLAILAAGMFQNALVDAVDISKEALEVAAINIREHGVADRVRLVRGNLFKPLKGKKYDLIITNPPYVDAEAVAAFPPEYGHEPLLAHAGGRDGLDLVRKIIDSAADHLNPGGGLLCEVGSGRFILETEYPHLPFLWLDTEESSGEMFWLARDQMVRG